MNRTALWKKKAFKRLGGSVCACCEEDRKPFLTIDHIHGNGSAHRKQFKGGQASFYKWIATTLNDVNAMLQILCMSCNWARRSGACPHQLDRPIDQVRDMEHVLRSEVAELESRRDQLKRELFNFEQVAKPELLDIPKDWTYIKQVAVLDVAELSGHTWPEATGADQQLAQKA